MSALDRFFQALAFLTIVPARAESELPADSGLLAYARYFPLAGTLIGLLTGGVYVLASLVWGHHLAALLAILAGIALTGALHEDGLADTADGFGGGWTRDQRLSIMKDSRLGAYGVLALIFDVALRVAALAELSPHIAFFALVGLHAVARFAPILVMSLQDYAGNAAQAKAVYGPKRLPTSEMQQASIVAALAVVPIFIMQPLPTIAALVLGAALCQTLALYSKKALGGYCGDVLGAIEQLFEIGFLLGLAALAGASL